MAENNIPGAEQAKEELTQPQDAEFTALREYLEQSHNFDFGAYKQTTLLHRVQRRMSDLHIDTIAGYQAFLESQPDEFKALFDSILINITGFFRDPGEWDSLAREALPRILAEKKAEPIRVWCAGVATGEEAFTVAMLLAEALGAEFAARAKIYATDVDERALETARHATYDNRTVQEIPEPLRAKYMEAQGNTWLVRGDLRRAVIFGRQDLLRDAPISHLDLIICRNTLIYFGSSAQINIITRFHYALNDPGFLFVGKAETLIGDELRLFRPLEGTRHIYQRVPQQTLRERLMAVPVGEQQTLAQLGRYVHLRDAAFDYSPVPELVVDAAGVVVLINEAMRGQYGMNPRDTGRALKDLEISYRPVELRGPLEQARSGEGRVVLANVPRTLPGGQQRHVDIIVQALKSEDKPIGAVISFVDVTETEQLREQVESSRSELTTAQQELQSSNEELETTNEELQSTVEELETTNEELQSANEELETMNEQMQASNTELQMVNDELRHRTEQADQSNAFLHAVLAGMRQVLIVVDLKLSVLVWNRQAEELWGVRTDEAVGHPFPTLDIGVDVGLLVTPLRSVLAGQADEQKLTLDGMDRRGRPAKLYITITPLVRQDGQRTGAIITLERTR